MSPAPPYIISASRRTDIPALYSKWFINRIREGSCQFVHPFSGAVHSVSLKPEDCLGIAFWTRFADPLLPWLSELESRGYPCYFMVTVTGYPRWLESHRPALSKAVDSFRKLADRLSPDAVHWRYDPIICSTKHSADWHLATFDMLSGRLEGFTRRCIISFVDFYGKTTRNLKAVEARQRMSFFDPSPRDRMALAASLAAMARERGMETYTCCEEGISSPDVHPGSCVSAAHLEALCGPLRRQPKRRPSRKDCRCQESIDIGAYDTCLMGCRYCYATSSREAARTRFKAHDPGDPFLWIPKRAC